MHVFLVVIVRVRVPQSIKKIRTEVAPVKRKMLNAQLIAGVEL